MLKAVMVTLMLRLFAVLPKGTILWKMSKLSEENCMDATKWEDLPVILRERSLLRVVLSMD